MNEPVLLMAAAIFGTISLIALALGWAVVGVSTGAIGVAIFTLDVVILIRSRNESNSKNRGESDE